LQYECFASLGAHDRIKNGVMTNVRKWVFVPVLALALSSVCQGQVVFQAPGSNAAPALKLAGTVFDSSGAPAPGVVLLLLPPTGANPQIKTDVNGKYTLTWQPRTIPAATYSLIARDLAHNFAAARPLDETTTNLDLHLQPALTLSAKVADPDGKPITNATGNLLIYSGTNNTGISRLSLINADDQGRIQFTVLPQGFRYSITIRAAGFGSSRQQMIGEADTQTPRLDLPPIILNVANLKLAGQILGALGQPAAGARVIISGAGQPTTNMVVDATGHFALNVCAGPVNINANVPGANGTTQTVGGDTNVVIRLNRNNGNIGSIPVKPAQRQVVPTAAAAAQARAQPTPLREQSWTWENLSHWPQQHRTVVIVLLSLQLTAMLGAAAGILWVARPRRSK
jgi:hypothetical protein